LENLLCMITENQIRQLIEARIAGSDLYILSVEISSGNHIQVELESAGSVSIEDCMAVSRAIEHNLDRDREDFSLQVSSPGLDKPLRDPRQFVKNVGRQLKVRLADGVTMEGDLVKADDDGIELQMRYRERVEGKKKKIWVEESKTLTYPEIKEAKVKINFK